MSSPVAMITGGSRGLGKALVQSFLRDGWRVATFSRSSTSFVKECQHADPEGISYSWEAIDATDHAKARKYILSVARRFGQIDALINNAATAVDSFLPMMKPSQTRNVLALNLEAALYLSQVCTKVMLKQGYGTITNVTSVNGIRGNAGASVYSATKAGVDGLTRSLARELGSFGIRVNSVAPGYMDTEMTSGLSEDQRKRIVRRTPLGRFATVSDVVAAVRFLTSKDAQFITGQTIVVDGGMTC